MNVLLNGYGPFGKTCGDCKNLLKIMYKDIEIAVCCKTAIDIISAQRACGLFEEIEEEELAIA